MSFWDRTITFYARKEEIEAAVSKLLAEKIDFSVTNVGSGFGELVEPYKITVPFILKEKTARILYSIKE